MCSKIYHIIWSGVLFLFLLTGCEDYPSSLSLPPHDSQALQFLDTVMEKAGGAHRWKKIDSLIFIKETTMYLPDSSVESHTLQKLSFSNYPEFYGEITYLMDEFERRVYTEKGNTYYEESGQMSEDPDKIEVAATNMRVNHYVIALPFKLLDKGVVLESVVNDMMLDGKPAKKLQVQHYNEQGMIKDEKWWLFFDPVSYSLMGYLIRHDGRHSYIVNEETGVFNGISFPLKRKSYALDSTMQNMYLRAAYTYDQIKISIHN